jgi:hypothetical protein
LRHGFDQQLYYHDQQENQEEDEISLKNGVSILVTQMLLEQSSPNLMNKVYTNIDLIICESVDQPAIQKKL